jgi:hypothetical protein
VQAPDGNRVPLLRAGFRPTDAYEVSFVFLHSGAPFAKKGGSELSLPSMDMPISVLEWEVYLPEQYKVKNFGGDAISAQMFPSVMMDANAARPANMPFTFVGGGMGYAARPTSEGVNVVTKSGTSAGAFGPGQIGGTIVDPTGAVIFGAQVRVTSRDSGVTRSVSTDNAGQWLVSGMPAGPVKVEASARGFKSLVINGAAVDATQGTSLGESKLNVGTVSTTVEVTAEAPLVQTQLAGKANKRKDEADRKEQAQQASANVFNLQKKVSGVLPVRVDVPRAGSSYLFARALVLDEETKLTFNYKTK